MSIFGELERVFSDYIYPVWPLFAALFVLGVAVAAVIAYRLSWHRVALRHRFITGAAVVLLLAVTIPVGYYTISPLFERNTVCEASPITGAGAGSSQCEGAEVVAIQPADDTTIEDTSATSQDLDGGASDKPAADTGSTPLDDADPDTEPQVISQGDFSGADDFHFGEGQALLIETSPGGYTLRFENFSVRNGPDLFVYLSPAADGYEDGALELGELKGTDGAFNYEVPAGTDVSRFNSAIVWCKAFSVLFATAPLS